MFSSRHTISAEDLYARISGEEILRRYVGVEFIPCLIHSPLRKDEHKSFSLFYSRTGTVLFKDHASGESGDAVKLLGLMWQCSRDAVIDRVWSECDCSSRDIVVMSQQPIEPAEIQVKVRKWEDHDIRYWEQFGISKRWASAAGIVPISHFILIHKGCNSIYKAEEYAYAFVHEAGVKIYQPYSQTIKWRSSQKKSHIQLYDKLPETGRLVCVCSSMKDALCLWEQLRVAAVAPQSEGTSLPPDVVKDLKQRFNRCCIIYDNDQAGLGYAREAAIETGFENLVLPPFDGGKDISDLYKVTDDKGEFKRKLKALLWS